MDMTIRKMERPEPCYCYAQSHQISMKSGLIGHLRADMGSDGKSFFSSFFDFRGELKSEAFSMDLQEVIDTFRKDGFLKDRDAMKAYCRQHRECDLGTGREFGVRVDTDNYTYMLRLNPNKGEYNLYCHCYLQQWLERHMKEAQKGIRFITPDYEEKFRIEDGDKIRIVRHDGETNERQCRYVDDTHFEMDTFGTGIFHICQFAEKCEETGVQALIPLRASLPEQCYSNLLETGAVVILKRGETGYYKTDIPVTDKASAIAFVEEYNRKLGVSPAQFEAMKTGSMFGFHMPAADPKNYDAQSQPFRTKPKDRGDIR